MSTLHQLRQGLSTAWDSLTEGWKEFRELAGDALTRFQSNTVHSEAEKTDGHIVNRASRWELLAAEVADDNNIVRPPACARSSRSTLLIVLRNIPEHYKFMARRAQTGRAKCFKHRYLKSTILILLHKERPACCKECRQHYQFV